MTTARVTAVMLDGTKHETVGIYMALADRVAFERLYDVSILDMRRETQKLGEDGTVQGTVSNLREERTAFFVWRTLRRAEVPCGEFEEFLAEVEAIELERLEGPADPTDADLPPGS